MKTRYPNVTVNPDRHGKLRARYRKAGCRPVYLKALPDQPGFEAELQQIKAASRTIKVAYITGTVHDLCARYYACADFRDKGNADTKARRRGIIESFRRDFGNDMVSDFGFEHIEAVLLGRVEKRVNGDGRTIGGEVAARKLRKELLRLFAYAKKLRWIASNPVEDAEKVGKAKLTGFHAWNEAEIAQYKRQHPIGTKARLALEIILWTGQRRGDARSFGPQHTTTGRAAFKVSKTQRQHGIMLAPDLETAIKAMPVVGTRTFLVTAYGEPYTKEGFGNKMREWCDQAGLPHCSAHGLRKAIARRVAETQGTQQQLKAVGGWRGDSEITLYTESAEQNKLADQALVRVISQFSEGGDA